MRNSKGGELIHSSPLFQSSSSSERQNFRLVEKQDVALLFRSEDKS